MNMEIPGLKEIMSHYDHKKFGTQMSPVIFIESYQGRSCAESLCMTCKIRKRDLYFLPTVTIQDSKGFH